MDIAGAEGPRMARACACVRAHAPPGDRRSEMSGDLGGAGNSSSAQIGQTIARNRPNLARNRPNVAEFERAWQSSTEFGTSSIKFGPKSAYVSHFWPGMDQNWPEFDQIRQSLAKFDRRKPRLDQTWCEIGQSGPNVFEVGSAKFDQISPGNGQIWAELGQLRVKLAKI